MSDSDDEDMALAIALSLGQNIPDSRAQKRATVIDITSDDEEEDDLDAPLVIKDKGPKKALSAAERDTRASSVLSKVSNEFDKPVEYSESSSHRSATHKSSMPSHDTPLSQTPSGEPPNFVANRLEKGKLQQTSQLLTHQTSQSGLLGLDRKTMEEERLRRASQRTACRISSGESQESQKRKRSPQTSERPTDRQVKPKNSRSTSPRTVPKVASFRDQKILGSSGIQFPE